MLEVIIAAVAAILGGGAAAAMITAMNKRWEMKFQRAADKEDRAEEKADKTDALDKEIGTMQADEERRNMELELRLQAIEACNKNQITALRVILLDRILQFSEYLIREGEVTFDQRRRLHSMHDCYHSGLGGNGDADAIIEMVNQLPLKHREGEFGESERT